MDFNLGASFAFELAADINEYNVVIAAFKTECNEVQFKVDMITRFYFDPFTDFRTIGRTNKVGRILSVTTSR